VPGGKRNAKSPARGRAQIASFNFPISDLPMRVNSRMRRLAGFATLEATQTRQLPACAA
jgi:hypothetical protein